MCRLGVLPCREAPSRGSANRRETMNKLKLLALAALAAATVGTGALAGPAPASAATATTTTSATRSLERPRICFVFGPWKYCI